MSRLTEFFAPRDREYFDLFEEAGRNVLAAAELLHRLLVDYPDSRPLAEQIRDCEHEGDRITHDIINRLNNTFVTPIDREDILALASALDDIVDYTEEVADYLGLYKIEAPMDQAIQLARVLHDACRRDRRGDPPPTQVRRHLQPHGRDQPARERGRPDLARRRRLAVRRAVDPMIVVRWKDLFERSEAAIDATEHAANILESIVIKNS